MIGFIHSLETIVTYVHICQPESDSVALVNVFPPDLTHEQPSVILDHLAFYRVYMNES